MATTELERVGPPEGGEVRVLETLVGPEGQEDAKPKGIKGLFKASANWGELRRTPYGMKPAVMFAILTFAGVFDGQVFLVAGPDIAQDLGIDFTAITGILSIVGIVSVPASLYLGWLADRTRRVPMLAIGSILSGFFSIVASQGRSALTLGAPRVVDAVSERVVQVPQFSLLTDYYPAESRGKVFALLGSTEYLPTLIAPPLAGYLVTQVGWRTTNVIFAVPLLVLGFIILFTMREPVRGYMERRALGVSEDVARVEDEPKSFAEAFRLTFAIRTLRRVFIAIIFIGVASRLLTAIIPFLLAEQYGLDAFQRGMMMVGPLLFSLLGAFLGGGLIDFFIRRNPGRVLYLLAGATSIQMLATLSLATIPPLWFFVLSLILAGFVGALTGPAFNVVFAQVLPASIRTQGLQTFVLAQLPGFIFLAPLGALASEYGYGVALGVGAAIETVGLILLASAAGFFESDMRSAFAEAAATEEWRRAKAAGQGKLLVCRSVDVAYNDVQVLFDVDFDVEEGEIIALLGTNGAGKSTLLRAISGTNEAIGGAIVFDGRDITHMPPHEVAARGVVHMPGGRGVFPGLTVRENILLGRWLGHEDLDIDARMAEVFEIFPILRERADALAGSLSGGEQQQLSLAQAFLAKPRLLMIDELSMGLSPAVVRQLLDVVREIHRRGVTIIVVEQSVNVALQIADRCVFMEKGEVRFFGRTSELLTRPELLRSVYVKGTGLSGRAALASAGFATGRGNRMGGQAGTGPILEIEGLTKSYGGVTAVDHVSFSVAEGESLGLVGPNGAGKTTIFDLVSGYQPVDSGTVRFSGIDITNLSAEERASRGLVRRFQDARMFPSLSVIDNILMALDQRHAARNALFSVMQLPNARRAERRLRARAEALIEVVGLEAYADKLVGELSTGLRRIADLACVLAAEPKLLLLDEPSTGMAQPEAEALAPLLRRVRYETGCSMLVIEHSMGLLVSVSDRLLALDRGAVVTTGSPDDVLSDERVVAAYLGGDPSASEDREVAPTRRRAR